ncbi:hypothetical protein HAV_00837 [Candidatus Hepatincola sp. Av]
MLKLITIFILFIITAYPVYAFDYESSVNIGAYGFSTDSDATVIGYLKQELSDDNFSFNVNLWLNNENSIYDFSTNTSVFDLNADVYSSYNINHNRFYLGYMDSVASKQFMYELLDRNQLAVGTHAINQRDVSDNNYIMANTYISNESAFSLSYLYEALDDRLYLGFTYTPNFNATLSNNNPLTVDNVKAALDEVLIYYNEYNALGYGFRVANRFYEYNNISNTDATFDFSGTLMLDYLGFYFDLGALSGKRHYDDFSDNNIKYNAFETSLTYYFGAFGTGIYVLDSKVDSYDNTFWEYDVMYTFNENMNLSVGLTYENLEGENSLGALIGLTLVY